MTLTRRKPLKRGERALIQLLFAFSGPKESNRMSLTQKEDEALPPNSVGSHNECDQRGRNEFLRVRVGEEDQEREKRI